MVAVDVMGGDFAPQAVVLGAYQAARRSLPVTLFGDATHIEALLDNFSAHNKQSWKDLSIQIEHCSEIIGMDEEPSRSVLIKKDSSLVRAMQAVVNGNAQAVISAGNSGACLVAGTLILGRTQSVLRPAIGGFLPTKQGSVFFIDLGANTDCKPEYLEQFAYMGHVFVRMTQHIEFPRIALLSNGSEPYKGSIAVKQAYERLQHAPLNFIGNIEARDTFDDKADVIVCDGFIGNIVLKSMQGTTRAMIDWIQQERSKSMLHTLGLFLSKGLFRNLKNKVDYAQKGGALLLGLNYPLIVAHGCSNAQAIENAIVFAHDVVQRSMVPEFNANLQQLLMQKEGTSCKTFIMPSQNNHNQVLH
jgi:glycerol-3-phosphate acyltransferase PlsX